MDRVVEEAAAVAGISPDQARAFLQALRDPGAAILASSLDRWIAVGDQDVALGPVVVRTVWSGAIDRALSD